MNIRKTIYRGWQRLPVRLLAVVIMTILPLNIISIVVSGMVLYNSTNQIKESYQRELDGGLTYFFNLMEDMDH